MPHRLLSLIAPPHCAICGDRCDPKAPTCEPCTTSLASQPRPLPLTIPGTDLAVAAAPYTDTARALVSALKFGKRLALADVAAAAIAHATEGALGDATIVPVPADPIRARLRGFDPAAEIAEHLARRLDLPLSHCLRRRHAKRQVGKVRAQRLTSAPAVRAHGRPPRTALLLDDVITTGTTLRACALALRQAGSEKILALAFAQA